jgi:GNAT superfamily N-acetyltransferase
MENEVRILRAKAGDIPILVSFNKEMARETEGKELDPEVLLAGVQGIFEKPGRGFYLVAINGDEVVGSLMVTTEWSDWRNGDFWWVQSVYVTPNSRKQGVFRKLYQRVREMAREEKGVCGCRLYVEKDNAAAQAVYLRRGFQETHYRLFEDCFDETTLKDW